MSKPIIDGVSGTSPAPSQEILKDLKSLLKEVKSIHDAFDFLEDDDSVVLANDLIDKYSIQF